MLLALLSVAAATPITIAQYGGHYFIPYYNHMQQMQQQIQQIERSDNYPAATESGGYGSDLTGGENHDFSSDNSASHVHPSSSGFDGGHEDYSSFDFSKLHGGDDGSHGGGYIDHGDNYVHSVPVSEHVEVTKPIAVPVYKDIGTFIKIIRIKLDHCNYHQIF